VQDCRLRRALQQGSQAGNIARNALLRAGLPVSVAGMSVDRQCASGLMAIATAAKEIIVDAWTSPSAAASNRSAWSRPRQMRVEPDPELLAMHNDIYMPMLQTAEVVAARYGIGRDRCDEYALQSQQRTAAAQAAGKFDAEIVPVTATMKVVNKETKEVSQKEVTLTKDEGNRADTTLEGLKALNVVLPNGTVTAGNASQLSDGSSACVLMEAIARRSAASAARPLCRHGRRRHQARRDGHRPGLRHPRCSSASTSRWTISACGS
jgi:acetyl-CoA C-acetyltransferase